MDQEDELVAQARAGAASAFSELVLRHQAAVRAQVARYLSDRETANDLAQECFLAAHRSLGTYRGEAPFRMWLLGIARRLVIAHLRDEVGRRRRRQDDLAAAVARWQAEAAEADEPSPAHDRELSALQGCLKKLSRDNAELIRSYYFQARTSIEIADRLGRSESAVRMALLRLRQALRACVQERLAAGDV
jgi:RNA polymerase sigma-70 factor (ECF subfamily)